METKRISVDNTNYKLVRDKHLMFDWKIEKEEKTLFGYVLTFSRDNETPYYSQLVELENEYGKGTIPSLLPTVLLPIISMILFTTFIILFYVIKIKIDFIVLFMALCMPGILLLISAVVLMFLRLKAIQNFADNKNSKDLSYKKKIEKLKNEHLQENIR